MGSRRGIFKVASQHGSAVICSVVCQQVDWHDLGRAKTPAASQRRADLHYRKHHCAVDFNESTFNRAILCALWHTKNITVQEIHFNSGGRIP